MNLTTNVIGVDENNYSPSIAGPIAVTALYPLKIVRGVNDSKQVSRKKQLELFPKLQKNSLYVTVPANISMMRHMGVYEARNFAMMYAVQWLYDILSTRNIEPSRVVIDGHFSKEKIAWFEGATGFNWVCGSDTTDYAVAAASIVGKVYTDIMFEGAGIMWPGYGQTKAFDYGGVTKEHADAIREHGVTPWHRAFRGYADKWWRRIKRGKDYATINGN